MAVASEREYKGYIIQLTPNWQFVVLGPDGKPIGATCSSNDQATALVDRLIDTDEKNKRQKLALAVLREGGEKLVIKGVHATQGYLLTDPPTKDTLYRRTPLYPDVPWLQRALEDLERLNQLTRRLRAVLADFDLSAREALGDLYGNSLSYNQKAEKVAQAYAKLIKKAQATTLENELAKVDKAGKDKPPKV